jgi:hypothetical protein
VPRTQRIPQPLAYSRAIIEEPQTMTTTHKRRTFQIGDKVQIISKSVSVDATNFTKFDCTHQGQTAYVVRVKGDGSGRDKDNCLVVHGDCARVKTGIGGDYFAPRDLALLQAA